MSRLLIIGLCLVLLASIASSADIQTFDTSFGKAQLDVPDGLEIKDPDSKSVIQFVMPGTEKPIISVVVDSIEIFGSDLEKYASAHFGEGKHYEETMTDAGYKMNFYDRNDYGSVHDYSGIINYTEDKEAIVNVFGRSETVAYGQTLATFSKDEFLSISKSFAFVDEKE